MCLIDRLNNKLVIIGGSILIIIVAIVHTVFGFLMEVKEFSVFALFDSSPLFDFELSYNCENKSSLTFHKWGGRIISSGDSSSIVDEADIKKINGNYFCYKQKSYLDLLYNGQIIKKGAECPPKYPNNCGILDTLEQELCIEQNEKCPLYDIGIGNKPDEDNYIYNENAKIYYNNENYNKVNKTIIGRLILNDGQPCYNSLENYGENLMLKKL